MPTNSAERLRRLHSLAQALKDARKVSARRRSSACDLNVSPKRKDCLNASPKWRRLGCVGGEAEVCRCETFSSRETAPNLKRFASPPCQRQSCQKGKSKHVSGSAKARVDAEGVRRHACRGNVFPSFFTERREGEPIFCRVPPPSAYEASARFIRQSLSTFQRAQQRCVFSEVREEDVADEEEESLCSFSRQARLMREEVEAGMSVWRVAWIEGFQERYRALRQSCWIQTRRSERWKKSSEVGDGEASDFRALLPQLLFQNLQAAATAADLSEVAVCASALEFASCNAPSQLDGAKYDVGLLSLNCKNLLASAQLQQNSASDSRKAASSALAVMKRLQRRLAKAACSSAPLGVYRQPSSTFADEWSKRFCASLRLSNFVRAFKMILVLRAMTRTLRRSKGREASETLLAITLALLPSLQKKFVSLLLGAGAAHWRKSSSVYAEAAETAAIVPLFFKVDKSVPATLLRERAQRQFQERESARRKLNSLPPRVHAQLLLF